MFVFPPVLVSPFLLCLFFPRFNTPNSTLRFPFSPATSVFRFICSYLEGATRPPPLALFPPASSHNMTNGKHMSTCQPLGSSTVHLCFLPVILVSLPELNCNHAEHREALDPGGSCLVVERFFGFLRLLLYSFSLLFIGAVVSGLPPSLPFPLSFSSPCQSVCAPLTPDLVSCLQPNLDTLCDASTCVRECVSCRSFTALQKVTHCDEY